MDRHRDGRLRRARQADHPQGQRAAQDQAKTRLRTILRDHEDGLTAKATNDTVADAVRDWLAFGLARRSVSTITNYRTIAETRIIAPLVSYNEMIFTRCCSTPAS